jgi:hypothetical protein
MGALAACVVAERSVDASTHAVRLVGAAESLRAGMGTVRPPASEWFVEVALSGAAEVLGVDDTGAACAAGRQAGADTVLRQVAEVVANVAC